jgi:hypothetical protein
MMLRRFFGSSDSGAAEGYGAGMAILCRPRAIPILLSLTCLGLSVGAPGAQARPTTVDPSPLTDLALNSVAVVPGGVVAWAAGNSITDGVSGSILHLANGRWSPVHYTAPAGQAQLDAVAAGSTHAAWVVGQVQNNTLRTNSAVVLHSTGGSFAPQSLPGTTSNVSLLGVAASSASNAWIAGNNDSTGIVPLAYRLVSGKWKPSATPHLPAEYQFVAVATSSPTNTWILANGPTGGASVPLRWNGRKWAKTSLPKLPLADDETAIATSGPKNVWIVGFTQTAAAKAFSYHYNGRKWARVAMSAAGSNVLMGGVAAVGAKAYAVGASSTSPVALSYSAGKWKPQRADKRGNPASLHAVAASSKLQVAVGSGDSAGQFQALIDVRSGSRWRRHAA